MTFSFSARLYSMIRGSYYHPDRACQCAHRALSRSHIRSPESVRLKTTQGVAPLAFAGIFRCPPIRVAARAPNRTAAGTALYRPKPAFTFGECDCLGAQIAHKLFRVLLKRPVAYKLGLDQI